MIHFKRYVSFVCVFCLISALLMCAACGKESNDLIPHNNDWDAEDSAARQRFGITLVAENVTPNGLTLVCEQSGGEDVAELCTGSYYVLQWWNGTAFVDVPYAPQEYDISWTMEAWLIEKEGMTDWDVNWTWLYGSLTQSGQYRIGKEVMNFRGPGDYDKEMIYAYFAIE